MKKNKNNNPSRNLLKNKIAPSNYQVLKLKNGQLELSDVGADLSKKGIIIFDMDDTLVNKEDVFVEAQQTMLKVLAQYNQSINFKKDFNTLREIDQELIHLNNQNHNYDYRMLANALWIYFQRRIATKKEVARIAFEAAKKSDYPQFIEKAVQKHNSILQNKVPELVKGTKEILTKLMKHFVLIIFSAGEEETQKQILDYYNLRSFFDLFFFTKVKNEQNIIKVKEIATNHFFSKYKAKPKRIIMVGDRISQDIIHAKKAGIETVWIPGPYFPGSPDKIKPDYTLSRLSELEKILNKIPFEKIWRKICENQGKKFHTKTGKPFTYRVEGKYVVPNRTEYPLNKSEFKKAYDLMPTSGPGEFSNIVRGPSYVWAILKDSRIDQKER